MVGQWRPVMPANSIDVMAIVLSFDTPLPELLMQRAISSLEVLARESGLDDVQPIHTFPFGMPLQPGVPGFPPSQRIGRLFTAPASYAGRNPDPGFKEQIQFDPNLLVYRTTEYSSWSDASRRYFELVGDTLNALSVAIAPVSVRLEYLDRFIPVDSAVLPPLSSLLRVGSKYLAPHVFEQAATWHSHTGAFLPKHNGRGNLLQVHVDAVEMQGPDGTSVRSLQIMTAREDRFPANSIEVDRGKPDILGQTLDELHAELMSTYRELIVSDVASAIGMTQ